MRQNTWLDVCKAMWHEPEHTTRSCLSVKADRNDSWVTIQWGAAMMLTLMMMMMLMLMMLMLMLMLKMVWSVSPIWSSSSSCVSLPGCPRPRTAAAGCLWPRADSPGIPHTAWGSADPAPSPAYSERSTADTNQDTHITTACHIWIILIQGYFNTMWNVTVLGQCIQCWAVILL